MNVIEHFRLLQTPVVQFWPRLYASGSAFARVIVTEYNIIVI